MPNRSDIDPVSKNPSELDVQAPGAVNPGRKRLERGLIYRIALGCHWVFIGLMVIGPLFPSSRDWDQRKSPASEDAVNLELLLWASAHEGDWVSGLPDRGISTFKGECTELDV